MGPYGAQALTRYSSKDLPYRTTVSYILPIIRPK